MIHIDVHEEKGARFKVLRTTDRTQLAIMTLPPGATADEREGLTESDRVIYVIEGRIELVVGDDSRELRAGEAAIVPAATSHRLKVLGRRSASIFNVYGPPAYPAEAEAEARTGYEHGLPSRGGWGGPGGYG